MKDTGSQKFSHEIKRKAYGKMHAIKTQGVRRDRKGFAQTDYIIAVFLFILLFALVVQYVSAYFASVGDQTTQRVIASQATALLDSAERGLEPANWPQTLANSSVVLLLHLDNSTLDSSQYGNNGTISGGANCSARVSGRLDSGCSFDGIDDYISVSDSGSLTFANEFSIAAWFRADAVGNPVLAGQKADAGATTAGYRIDIGTAISGSIDARVSNGTHQAVVTGPAIAASTWYHVTVTYKTNDNLNIFINGTLFNSTSTASVLNPINSNQALAIGARSDGAAQFFNGTIDEVTIWNRTLNESEIYALWAYESLLDRIGLYSRAYRFFVVVNNSLPYWKNQSQTVETIGNELVRLNFTEIGYGVNIPSVYILEANGSRVGYEINGNTVTFRTAINANSAKNFTVYFDDDSNFVEQTQSLTGVDNLTEVIEPVENIHVIQNRKMTFMTNANYTRVKNSTGLPRDFGIRMNDVDANNNVFDFGPPEPPSGDVVAYRRFALYQNATGAVRKGRLTIQVW